MIGIERVALLVEEGAVTVHIHTVVTEHHIAYQALGIGIDILFITDYIGIEQIDPVGIHSFRFGLGLRYVKRFLSRNCQESQHEHQ